MRSLEKRGLERDVEGRDLRRGRIESLERDVEERDPTRCWMDLDCWADSSWREYQLVRGCNYWPTKGMKSPIFFLSFL